MPELFIELFSEEIPARMQAGAAADLARLLTAALAELHPADIRTWYGPRRLALAARMAGEVPAAVQSERGPRTSAPPQAVEGFLRKHAAPRESLREENGFLVLERSLPARPAAAVVAGILPDLLRRFPWPKSMRWGGGSAFVWVRPLRRITCLLDGAVVPFDLRQGEDDGHGLASANVSEGHRFLAPGTFPVTDARQWGEELRRRFVIADADERRRLVRGGVEDLAAAEGLAVVDDPGLVDEVAGLVEWPVSMLGRIDPAYMDLPPEVMQVSMRVNQRYFALRRADGSAADRFAFVANVIPDDGGRAIVAGNERVLRARFADARHFWDLDRRVRLEDRLPALDGVTFHARLGSQGARARRIAGLAGTIATALGTDANLARRAGILCKADLVAGMVGEFPELQGVMGGYYAAHDGETPEVAEAIRRHYAPRGPHEAPPTGALAAEVALADKLDTLVGFFAVGEKPSGAGDPFALRRAALGVVRILREGGLRLALRPVLAAAAAGYAELASPEVAEEVLAFVAERLRVQLRGEGARHDVLAAVLGAGLDDDLVRLLARTDAVASVLATQDGANLLAGYRRAANILRIEEAKDGPHDGPVAPELLRLPSERELAAAGAAAQQAVPAALAEQNFTRAMAALALLRAPLDAFFAEVMVNDPQPELRRNRLALLARVRATMNQIAEFSRIEG
ncbi:MAG: glycine--tRNA ligase subunit beta [Rhodospirillales bacterium]|nr:glycine--tRNA ligase subunit beta [Rhodospirillales bacterium]